MKFQEILQLHIKGVPSYPLYTSKIMFIKDGMTYGIYGLEPVLKVQMYTVFANIANIVSGDSVQRAIENKKPDDIIAIYSSTGKILITTELEGQEMEYSCKSIEIEEIFIEVPTQYSKTTRFNELKCLNGEDKNTLKWEEIKTIEPMMTSDIRFSKGQYTNLFFKGKEYFMRYNIPHTVNIVIDWEKRSLSLSVIVVCSSRPQSDRDGGWEHIVKKYSAYADICFDSKTSMRKYLKNHDSLKYVSTDHEKAYYTIEQKIDEAELSFGVKFSYSYQNSIEPCGYDD